MATTSTQSRRGARSARRVRRHRPSHRDAVVVARDRDVAPITASCWSMSCSVRSIATGCRPPSPPWKGSSRKCSSSSIVTITATTLPMNRPWTTARSPLSAKPSRKTNTIAEMKNSPIHSGAGITPGGAVDAVLAGLLPVRGLVEPLAVGRLLVRESQLDRLQRPEHRHAPRVDVLAERAVLHARPTRRWMTDRA